MCRAFLIPPNRVERRPTGCTYATEGTLRPLARLTAICGHNMTRPNPHNDKITENKLVFHAALVSREQDTYMIRVTLYHL